MPEDHEYFSRLYASGLRSVVTRRGPGSRAAQIAAALSARSAEFRSLWERHEVGITPRDLKRYQHPAVGLLELNCQTLQDPEQSHALLVYTATPGTETYRKLELLSVVGVTEG